MVLRAARERFRRILAMKVKLDRIISIATLTASVAALVLVLHKPPPLAPPLAPTAIAAHAQSFQTKIEQLEQPRAQGQGATEVRLTSQEVTAGLAQASGALPAGPSTASGGGERGPDLADSGDPGPGEANVKDY